MCSSKNSFLLILFKLPFAQSCESNAHIKVFAFKDSFFRECLFKELGQKVYEQKFINEVSHKDSKNLVRKLMNKNVCINEVLHININSQRLICLQGHVLKQMGHQVDKLQKYEKVNFARHCCGCRRTYKLLEFTCFRP